MFVIVSIVQIFFQKFLQVSNSYLHLIRLRTNDSIYNDVIRYSLVETYYCRDKVYPARCLFLKYVRYNRHQNMATPAMAIKAAIAKAAFAILPFSIETELRLKYFMYTILIEVWGLSFVVSRSLLVSKPLQRKLPIRRINLLSIIATFIYHNFRDNVIMISQFLHLSFKINRYYSVYNTGKWIVEFQNFQS